MDSRTKPPWTIPRWTNPPPPRGQNPPGQNPPPRTKPPQTKPPGQNPPGEDSVHFKFRWLQSSIINMMSGKLYVYIQLQMRYLITSGST